MRLWIKYRRPINKKWLRQATESKSLPVYPLNEVENGADMKLIVPAYIAIILAMTMALAGAVAAKSDRPTDLKAADLGITEAVFIDCFSDVQPAHNKNPSSARQQMNKSILLPCLQAANASITNEMLDNVMDRYRPEGPMKHS